MIPTNPELISTIGEHENITEVRLDITRSAAYLVSEEGYEMALDLDINDDLFKLEIKDRFTFALGTRTRPCLLCH